MIHITIGAAPKTIRGEGVTLEQELRMLKAGLLYGDQVKLYSASTSLFASFLGIAELGVSAKPREKMSLIGELFGDAIFSSSRFDIDRATYNTVLAKYDQLCKVKHPSGKVIVQKKALEKRFSEMWTTFAEKITDMSFEAGVNELDVALESGLVEVDLLLEDGESQENDDVMGEMLHSYVDKISRSVRNQNTFPLLDKMTGDIVRAKIKEQRLIVNEIDKSRSRQVGLAADLFDRLPNFDLATVDQVLDIRDELSNPLKRFRSSLSKLSSELQPAQWDDSFANEARRLFIEEVEPAIAEIEHEIESNSYLRELVSKGENLQSLAIPSLSIAMATADLMPVLIALAMGGGSAGMSAMDAFHQYKEKRAIPRKNPFFFYYKVKKNLD